jgi:hypothetical protein
MTITTIEAARTFCADCGIILESNDELDSGFCQDCVPIHACNYCKGVFDWCDMHDEGICYGCEEERELCYECDEWKPFADFGEYGGCICCDCHVDWFDYKVSDTAPGGASWEDYEAWAEESRQYDFGCDFDCNGCVAQRDNDNRSERGCCDYCAYNHGYLDHIKREALPTVKALYSDKTGFWTPTGCALPAKWRSITCLEYSCGTARDNDKRDHADIEAWMHARQKLVQLS